MSVELKVKSKHLSVESQIIRFEERKLRQRVNYYRVRQASNLANTTLAKMESLSLHRRWDVRNENRATFLARAFLAGKPYASVERSRRHENEWTFRWAVVPRVVAMVNKYGKRTIDRDAILEWAKL